MVLVGVSALRLDALLREFDEHQLRLLSWGTLQLLPSKSRARCRDTRDDHGGYG